MRIPVLQVDLKGHKFAPPKYCYHKFIRYGLYYNANTRKNRYHFDVLKHIKNGTKTIQDQKIKGIFCTSDLGSIIASILANHNNLIAPSIESVLNCFHKGKTRQATNQNHHVRYELINLKNGQEPSFYPCYIKAPCSNFGNLAFPLHTQEDWERVKPIITKELPFMNKPLFDLVDAGFLPHETILRDPIMLVEEMMIGPQMTLEGYVYDGNIFPLFITDTNFMKTSRLIDNFSFPSRLSAEDQNQLAKLAKKDIHSVGLDNSFFNVEYVKYNGSWKLIEINGRMAASFRRLYHTCTGYQTRKQAMKLCIGQKPANPKPASCIGGQFNIITQKSGKMKDLFNFEVEPPTPIKYKFDPEEYIGQLSEHGRVLGQFELFGKNYDTIKTQADAYRRQALI